MTVVRELRSTVPQDADEYLKWLLSNGFTERIMGDSENPSVMLFAAVVDPYIDIVHIRGQDRTEAARIPFDEHANIWRPRFAVWHYYGDVVTTLAALQRLTPPGSPDAPITRYEVIRDGDNDPLPLWITETEQQSVTTMRAPVNVTARTTELAHAVGPVG